MSPRPSSSWAGRPAEHLEFPSTTQPSPTDVPRPPSPPTTPGVNNRRWMAPCLRAGSGERPVSSLESWKRPIESLVQRFKRHSLKPNSDFIGNGSHHLDSTASSLEETTLGVLRRQGDDLMEVDAELGDQQTAGPALPTQRVSKVADATCTSTSHTQIHHQSNQHPAGTLYLQPTPQSQLPESTSPSILPEIQTALRRGAWSAADAAEDVTDELQIDEGYCDDMDDFAEIDETGHGRSLIRSLANHAQSSGVLKYRTSAEAALSCPRIVHRAPRMRRRRQQKQQTRLKTSSTGSTCGSDSQAAALDFSMTRES